MLKLTETFSSQHGGVDKHHGKEGDLHRKDQGKKVKSRLAVQGQKQKVRDLDDTFASTPMFTTFRLLILLALSMLWSISFFDVSTAFLHADLKTASDEKVLMWPPDNFYEADSNVIWEIHKAMAS